MKPIYLQVILVLFVLFTACDSGEKTKQDTSFTITVNASEPGAIYLDGQYTGYTTPAELKVSEGQYVIGVATQTSHSYLRKELTINEDTDLMLTTADKPEPKVWKALWVGVHEVTGLSESGQCSSQFSKEELDAGYDFFMWSIENHFEPFSFNTTKWEVERKDINTPIQLHKASNTWFTLEPESITELIPEIDAGNYDAVFVFWREKDGSCSFKSSYFGLAWIDPLNDPIKTGYITIKFDAGDNIQDNINWYKENDPGVWVHEWLHTVGENYFQDRGERMPEKGGDGLVLHAAEKYQYTYPWMDWYRDFMTGQVKELGSGHTYCGIGPEALLQKSLRESAME
ncbi:PEGA domain-containing protein [Carboxylicivirga mesophila]|uniref:PEGA domain-containing protein n=1 Tax=Carboxylicivirga mesophila TaxID=1166478 RepID=A0ABS5K6T4_9BACT|nr:PEGA domain-containing protein [Carboxylicivirga mesophila]MBS2210679.1 PEGA domain-containing protein [Carboxylicivirga mesophila]